MGPKVFSIHSICSNGKIILTVFHYNVIKNQPIFCDYCPFNIPWLCSYMYNVLRELQTF